MLALLLIALSWLLGRQLYRLWLGAGVRRLFRQPEALVPEWVVREPIALSAGTLFLGWFIYLSAWSARGTSDPLAWGNAVAAVSTLGFLWWSVRRPAEPSEADSVPSGGAKWAPWAVLLLFGGGFALLCRQALWIEDGKVGSGLSVFSDYGPHLAVMRSFSLGQNFPTEYPHFPDGSARYHFMFQFWSGNLEFLGLRLDWALNVPSVIAYSSACLLLYALGAFLSQSWAGGGLTVLFFGFRSGSAAWDFLMGAGGPGTFWGRFWANEQFIGATAHEDWGLWNQNVYLNQRHLALGLSVAFFALLHAYSKLGYSTAGRQAWGGWLQRAGWWSEDRRQLFGTLAVGALIGAAAFWNGATVIGTLLMLAVVGLVSPHRLEWLGLATVAGILCWVQNRLFLRSGELAVAPEVVYGFLSEKPESWSSVGVYLRRLLGVQPFLVVLSVLGCAASAFARRNSGDRGSARGRPLAWFLVFLIPLVLAFTVRLTPDIAINHKYVMLSVTLLNVFAAVLLVALWRMARIARPAVVALVLALTLTGIIDLRTLVNKNRHEAAVIADMRDPVHVWLVAYSGPRDRLLTDWYSYHTVLLTGRRIFYGWPYYAWGAGYDVQKREAIVKEIYGGEDAARTLALLRENKIRYVLIDDGNRRQEIYKLKEAFLRELLEPVFEHRDTVILRVPAP